MNCLLPQARKEIVCIGLVVFFALNVIVPFHAFLKSEKTIVYANETPVPATITSDVGRTPDGTGVSTPTPTNTPQNRPDSVTEAILDTFKGAKGRNMLAIAKCESGLNPNAINTSNYLWGTEGEDHGIFQINDFYNADLVEGVDLYDYKQNIAVAKKVFDRQGYEAWSCWKSGAYKNHL